MNIKGINSGQTLLNKGDRFFRTKDTRFASALLTLGFNLWAKQPYTLVEDVKTKQQQITWNFNSTSNCGKFRTLEMKKCYHDPSLMDRDDEHSVALSRCIATLKNRELLIDICNNAEPILKAWRDDGNLWYVPANTEVGQEIIKEHQK